MNGFFIELFRFVLVLVIALPCVECAYAEGVENAAKTNVTYDLTAESAFGTGDYNAYQMVTNRHHILGTRSNTAYMRTAVNVDHRVGDSWKLAGCVDAVLSLHADHKVYLQQCYLRLVNEVFFVEAGNHEDCQVVRDDSLSVGSFVKGTNAKPIPQVRIGTNGFQTVPYTKDWVQVNFEMGYGKFLDGDYRRDVMTCSNGLNTSYISGAYYHQKHLYIRSNPNKRFFAMIGIEHAVQFGATCRDFTDGTMKVIDKPANMKAFMNVILPLGDDRYYEHQAYEDWVYGNHIGMMTYQIGCNITPCHRVQAYLDNPFEDGSGVRKGNGYDGLWGLQYSNTSAGRQIVRAAVVEYFQSTNQSGPLHWDSADYPEPIRSQVTEFVTGADDYYNHMFYDGYQYYGMTPGIALITSPIYNKDGYSGFRDTRMKAIHVGVRGELTARLSYMLRGSYREGWGTYYVPLVRKHHSFDAMIQGTYDLNAWNVSAAYGLSRGNIYGDCSTFNIRIGYHGKIF